MRASWPSLLFLVLLGLAIATKDTQECTSKDKTFCESWASAVEEQDATQGLEMLQLKGAKLANRNCPMPDENKYRDAGKGCFQGEAPPGEDEACLAGNKEFMYLDEAWRVCGQTANCGAVMQLPNGFFKLRRLTDPDTKKGDGSKLYVYECTESEQKQQGAHKKAQNKPKEVVKRSHDQKKAAKKEDELHEVEKRTKELKKETQEAEKMIKEEAEEEEVEEEDGEVQLLQIDRSSCPMPDAKAYRKGGKSCPNPGTKEPGCLNQNIAYSSLEDAWQKCTEDEFCGAVMEYEKQYYLRRSSDPDIEDTEKKLFTFPCKQQEMQYKEVMEKAQEKADMMMRHARARASEQKYEEVHDEQTLVKAEEELVKKASDRHQQELINEQHQAQQHLNWLKKDYKTSEATLAEQEEDLAQSEVMLKPVETQATKYADELDKSVARLHDVGEYRSAYQTELQELDEAKYQVEVASQVKTDAQQALEDAQNDVKHVKEEETQKLQDAQEAAQRAMMDVVALKKREKAEESELHMLQSELKKLRDDVKEQDSRLAFEKDELKALKKRKEEKTATQNAEMKKVADKAAKPAEKDVVKPPTDVDAEMKKMAEKSAKSG